MDLMTTDTLVQHAPIGGGLLYRRQLFYARFHTNGSAEVDVFSHNVNRMHGSLRAYFGYFFPQPFFVGAVLAHISKCEARPVIVVPNTRASWFPMIEGPGVRSVQIAFKGKDSQFFKVLLRTVRTFHRHHGTTAR